MSKYLNWTWVINLLKMFMKGGVVMAKKKLRRKN